MSEVKRSGMIYLGEERYKKTLKRAQALDLKLSTFISRMVDQNTLAEERNKYKLKGE